MTNPRDPRHRRQHADPLAAAVRLSMGADAMRGLLLERGQEVEPTAESLAAAVQLAPHEPPLTAAEFAAALGDVETEEFCPDCFAGVESSEHHEKCVRPAESVTPPARPAFIPERSTPPVAWRSRHDERSRAYGLRPRLTGSTPLQDRLLPTGPVLDQLAAGATLEEQSCCTGTGTVAAVNTLRLLAGERDGLLDLDDAEAIYQLGKDRDQYPGDDYAGGSVLGAMTAAVELGHVGGFLWCFGTRDVAQAVLAGRPVVVGVRWPSGMWETGPGGLVRLDGADEGLGHCLAVVGIALKGPQGQPGPFFRWQQSAGEAYGDGGFGWIHHRDLGGLLRGRGEAAVPTLQAQAAAP